MRVASRVIGAVLAIAGVAFFGIAIGVIIHGTSGVKSVLIPQTIDRNAWTASAISAGFGVVLVLAGWYFLKFDPE